MSKATRTITKRGNAEQVPCYINGRGNYNRSGDPSLEIEVRLRSDDSATFLGEFKVDLTLYEARTFAMELLNTLDTMQYTKKPK
jgi:hypothetical protein